MALAGYLASIVPDVSKEIWDSPEVMQFTVDVATIISDNPAFGEFRI
jgi:hypothetical protein